MTCLYCNVSGFGCGFRNWSYLQLVLWRTSEVKTNKKNKDKDHPHYVWNLQYVHEFTNWELWFWRAPSHSLQILQPNQIDILCALSKVHLSHPKKLIPPIELWVFYLSPNSITNAWASTRRKSRPPKRVALCPADLTTGSDILFRNVASWFEQIIAGWKNQNIVNNSAVDFHSILMATYIATRKINRWHCSKQKWRRPMPLTNLIFINVSVHGIFHRIFNNLQVPASAHRSVAQPLPAQGPGSRHWEHLQIYVYYCIQEHCTYLYTRYEKLTKVFLF